MRPSRKLTAIQTVWHIFAEALRGRWCLYSALQDIMHHYAPLRSGSVPSRKICHTAVCRSDMLRGAYAIEALQSKDLLSKLVVWRWGCISGCSIWIFWTIMQSQSKTGETPLLMDNSTLSLHKKRESQTFCFIFVTGINLILISIKFSILVLITQNKVL